LSGADYSYARPGGAVLAAAGISSVGRYLGSPGDGRCLTRAEYDDLTAHGIDVWLIREATGREMLNGRAEGQNQARTAQAAIERLGLPSDSVVYFTADFAVQPSQYGVCDDYLRGVNDVFQDTDRIGLYAGVPYIVHVKSWGGAAYWWKPGASSWSGGQSTDLHLEQLVGTAGGIPGTDANIIYQDDHGQIGAQVAISNDDLHNIALAVLTAAFDSGQILPDGSHRQVQLWQALQGVFFYGDKIYAQNVGTQTAVAALGAPVLSDAQIESLATQIAAKLPANQAATKADVEDALKSLTLAAVK
jgi:hypothetical protein